MLSLLYDFETPCRALRLSEDSGDLHRGVSGRLLHGEPAVAHPLLSLMLRGVPPAAVCRCKVLYLEGLWQSRVILWGEAGMLLLLLSVLQSEAGVPICETTPSAVGKLSPGLDCCGTYT